MIGLLLAIQIAVPPDRDTGVVPTPADSAVRAPGSDRAIQVAEGDVPVQMRHVVVDVSRLARGTYLLTLTMNAPRRAPVSSERTFHLR